MAVECTMAGVFPVAAAKPFMPSASYHSSLTRQVVLPIVGLLLAAVLANVGFSAWLAVQRSAENTRLQQRQVAAALTASRVSLSLPVLDALQRLTGSHFIIWNEASQSHGLSTLSAAAMDGVGDTRLAETIATGAVAIGGQHYRIGVVHSEGVRPETVLILTPVRAIFTATLEAVWPVLAVAVATLAVLVPLVLHTTGRLSTRIGAIERHVGRITEGEFGQRLLEGERGAANRGDEIGRLVAGVNTMSTTLGELRTSLVAGERQRLLGQLAAGFAHELRNAITGARLAIDLHRRRCTATARVGFDPDESLTVAVRQLDILEEEVRGLLALGKAPEAAPAELSVTCLLEEVRDLMGPRCEHAGVRMECQLPTSITCTGRHDSLRAALVNLALNGIDAAGRGGCLRLVGGRSGNRVLFSVEDTGPGPPESIRDTIHEPFVTGKPEGIGLGLAVAKAVAEEHGGTLDWERIDGCTRFTISLPSSTLSSVPAPQEQTA